MQKTPNVFPIIGGRKVEHLKDNLEALDITLTPEQIKFLESQVPFDIGFPISMIVSYTYVLHAITLLSGF
jgi:diketogulonate reductase-like aldo/keto reductase